MKGLAHTLFAATIIAALALAPAPVTAQGAPTPVAERSYVQVVRLKPDMVDTWIALQQNEVIPAQKKAGVASRVTLATVVGNSFEFLVITPFPLWSAMDGDSPLVRALGREGAAALNAKLRRCILTQQSYMVTRSDSLSVAGTDAMVWRQVVRGVVPGKIGELRTFVRDSITPAMRKAAADGRIAGYTFAARGIGAPNGELTTSTLYNNFAGLESGDPLVSGTGAAAAAALNARLASLAPTVQVIIRRRRADLSF
jgi:hypothetical protein